ncbi:STAS-like domain-containing protein [Rhodospirillum rubrum]|uniref:STAS-like domain-containing protein n=1 Tax=Rhodospirillum rubrum TaxID=1085 RepID=UPI0009DB5927|nr:STAS-like domain-containing protein [Rhodospirillum rubrum]MBK5954706.1 hypothetical protein [Rhodospirillum rubrum]QXG79062.1 STAS-like domain-containing protein [Rhodospirillum rubrum]HAP99119.1 DUF4325 domain-containing protein [Rhodospirillum rubrum]HCF18320.1 DUF4325 domain-containing protein [Rhodospirillum rubrum]
MVIRVIDLVSGGNTNDQGDIVRQALLRALADSPQPVIVSFSGFTSVTSSFVNSAFVELLDCMSLDQIKAKIRFVNSNRQINDMIRTRLTREATGAFLAA